MTIRSQVERYVLNLAKQSRLDPSLDLFQAGFLTSLDVLDLLSFVENNFHVEVSDDDLGADNFGSINGIVDLVKRLTEKA